MNTCRVSDCALPEKADHPSLHAATDDQLASTPTDWPTYARNQAELARRSAQ